MRVKVSIRFGSFSTVWPSSSKIKSSLGMPFCVEHRMDVLGLRHGHARIVPAVLDEERRADRVDVRHRRRLDQERAVALERAVLALACGAPVRRRVLEEGDEARDADAFDAGRPPLRLERERGEHHVAAVRAPVDDRAVAVDVRARGQPVVQRREIRHRVEPLLDVVEMLVPLAVTRRAAHVRRRDRVAARRRGTASAARSSARTTAATATPGRRAPSRRPGTARRPPARRGRPAPTRRRSSRSGAGSARRASSGSTSRGLVVRRVSVSASRS